MFDNFLIIPGFPPPHDSGGRMHGRLIEAARSLSLRTGNQSRKRLTSAALPRAIFPIHDRVTTMAIAMVQVIFEGSL